MSHIVIGKHGERNVSIDLDLLLSTRMLVTADSGGGKTYALKRICEQAFGKIQIIVIDPEGEFSPLRQKKDFVLVGKGGDTPADPRSAAMLAERLLELRASAICDLYEMKPSARHDWVRLFLEGLIEAPKKLRHPCLVIVDEAHIFAPEKGKGESTASDSMIGLCTRGRKRLLCAVFATQRLATLSKDASSMLLNRLVGGQFEDVNRKRAVEVLSVAKEDQAKFQKEIQILEPGLFYALGRAVSKERVLVHIGAIESPHGQEAAKYELTPPPAPDEIRALLPKLADLPKEAEEKARTDAEFRAEIRSLKAQLKAQPTVEKPVVDTTALRALQEKLQEAHRLLKERDALLRQRNSLLVRFQAEAAAIVKKAAALAGQEVPELPALKLLPVEQWPRPGTEPKPPVVRENRITEQRVPRGGAESNGHLPPGEKAILIAAAQMEGVDRRQASILTGYKRSSRDAYIARLKQKGYVDLSGDQVIATQEGVNALGSDYEELPTGTELAEYWLRRLPDGERKVLEILIQHHGNSVDRDSLDERTGYQRSSRDAYLSRLQSKKLVEVVGRGQVKASEELF